MSSIPDSTSLRVDPLRGWATIVAPTRAQRPVDPSVAPGPLLRGHDLRDRGDCPFCPGSEDQLEAVLQELPSEDPREPWGARAVRNRYPFLSPHTVVPADHTGVDGAADPAAVHPARGDQEVLIDTSRHDGSLADLGPGSLHTSLCLWKDRTQAAHGEAPEAEVHLFRNEGWAAGTSRSHPHSQLVRTHDPTPGRTSLLGRMRHHHERAGTCMVCVLGELEPHVDRRRVLRSEHFEVRTLWAPLDPGHLRILPRRHCGSLAGMTSGEVADLASVLGQVVGALRDGLGDPDWNLLVHDAGPGDDAALHWHLELRPRLGRGAGFEQSAQLGVCSGDPVADAERLRSAISPNAMNPTIQRMSE